MYLKQDFTETTASLSKAHGVHQTTITVWTKEGAFPFARREGERTTLYFHKDCLKLTGGKLKDNRERGLYKDPIHIFEALPSHTAKPKRVEVNFDTTSLEARIDGLERMLKRIETKIHAVAEGRPLHGSEHFHKPSSVSIGSMIKKSVG